MKKVLFLVLCVTLVVGGLTFSYAQESSGTKDLAADKQWMMCKQRMRGQGSCGGSMMKSMMSASLVETKDGGVIVMLGTKLMKYDKDLNLVKEAEVKMDIEGMQKMMQKMMENCPCPYHKEAMKKGSCMKGGGSGMKE